MATIPTSGVEVFYPIQPTAKSNKLVFRKDSMIWNGVQKSSSLWRHEVVTLKYQIQSGNISAFYGFHITNKGIIATLNFPGIQPFLRAAESNDVYILHFSKPKRILGLHYEMTGTYINSVITA